MMRLIPKKWRVTLISLLFARLTLNNWRAKLISLIVATMLWYLIKKNLETTPSPSEPRDRPTATETP
jgi:YbbR domain-containing protein